MAAETNRYDFQQHDPVLTFAQFGQRYKISRSQIYRERAAGRLKVTHFGGAARILVEDAEAWVRLAVAARDAAVSA